jgi:hypothetical protein
MQYTEFQALASHRAVKLQAEAKSRKTQDIYAKLDRQEARRKRWRWLGRLVSNVKGLVSLVIYLVIIVAICVGAWQYGLPYLREHVLNQQPATPAASAPAAASPATTTSGQAGSPNGH